MNVTDTLDLDEGRRVAQEVFASWLTRFAEALEGEDARGLADCVIEDGYWKDILTFAWEYQTFSGRLELQSELGPRLAGLGASRVRIAPDRAAPRLLKRSAKRVVEGFFEFSTATGRSSGFARLLLDDESPEASKAWLLLTALQELHGFEERVGSRRPTGLDFSQDFAGPNWLDRRIESQRYDDREPEVLIVGGGQSGLTLAARLGRMGVDSLIVEKNPRVGDNWRRRYHALTLHNEAWANSLPYMPFPPNWHTFLPKDKLAGWLEAYAEFMELNVWSGTEFLSGQFDESTRTWTVRVRRDDGEVRVLRVPQMVLATGTVSGLPRIPELPGLADFEGEVIHSSRFTSGRDYEGKQALVIGTGNSGHDVAQDLQANSAAAVTIMQRSPTCVVSLVPSGTMVYSLYSESPGIDDIDLITAAIPYPVLRESYQWLTKKTCELDRDLLDGLESVGFETEFEPDGTGFHMRYLRSGGGYYINVGCSDLIAEGKIDLVHARQIARFDDAGLILDDGSELKLDLVVLATGFENQQEGVRRLFGDEVAEKVGPIWGFDENGFMRNMWCRTGQDSFWIMGGALNEARLYSRFLALQIKGALEGLLPEKDLAALPGAPSDAVGKGRR